MKLVIVLDHNEFNDTLLPDYWDAGTHPNMFRRTVTRFYVSKYLTFDAALKALQDHGLVNWASTQLPHIRKQHRDSTTWMDKLIQYPATTYFQLRGYI